MSPLSATDAVFGYVWFPCYTVNSWQYASFDPPLSYLNSADYLFFFNSSHAVDVKHQVSLHIRSFKAFRIFLVPMSQYWYTVSESEPTVHKVFGS